MTPNNILIAIGFAVMFAGLVLVMVGVWNAPMLGKPWKPDDPGQVLTDRSKITPGRRN